MIQGTELHFLVSTLSRVSSVSGALFNQGQSPRNNRCSRSERLLFPTDCWILLPNNMTKACWMLFLVLFLVCLQRSWSQMQFMDLIQGDQGLNYEDQGLNYDSGWPPGQNINYVRLARDLKTQFFNTLTGDKQQQAAAEGTKRRDRITALFIKLMTRLFRQRPFQRLLCGSNATCLANLNTPTF